MKKFVLLCMLVSALTIASAKHIMGGFIQYKYLGVGAVANTSDYSVTVTLFINCITGPTVPPENSIVLGVFDALTSASAVTQSLPMTLANTITKNTFDPCLSDPPLVCYIINVFSGTVELPDNPNGYILAVQSIYRVNGIINIENSGQDAILNFSTLPGVVNGVDYHTISSPSFVFEDTVVICHNSSFTYQFNATDPDGDTLTYAFGNGLNAANAGIGGNPGPPSSPPFPALIYSPGYSGASPLGPGVSINTATGVISGTAPPDPGVYVVAVYVSKWKNGTVISITKKELQISVADCSLTAAALRPLYINCNNYTFYFENQSAASNIATYRWTFGVSNGAQDTSVLPTPSYTYADTGTYTLKLMVTNTAGCSDSASATVKVYPGFNPDFTVNGSCYQTPFRFTDSSTAAYGTINSWLWNFGDPSSTADTSSRQNPFWQYTVPGTATVTLAVTSSKGCSGTASKTVSANDKPALYLPFTDTLICSNDTLPLIAQSSGSVFSWAPAYNIINSTSANPVVYPYDTTVYTVIVKNNSCVDSATVTVNVLQFITVSLPADTAICETDSIALRPHSYALSYLWQQPAGVNSLSSNTVKYPNAAPSVTTLYHVTANLGHCQASAQEIVYVSAYPSAMVGNDATICFGKSVRLHGTTAAAYYSWSPANTLYQADTLAPLAGPEVTTNYYFTVRDTFYCPKSTTDTVTVTVIPPVKVNAGDDTSAVINQPLQLLAASNNNTVSYTWSPAAYLSNQYIYNPVAVIGPEAADSVVYTVTATTPAGCFGIGYVTVRVFKTVPDIFVPSAFTPNGDGKNDVIKPVLAGIAKLYWFRVYSRWGQCVFETSQEGKGWDGNVNGRAQPSGAYVFMAQGKDYLGNIIFKKGSIVLIR